MALEHLLADKEWRIEHLYSIVDKNLHKVVFKKNKAQRDFDQNKHTRNIILKSRRLGFTTFEAIDNLDDTLFTRNFSSLFIAHTQNDAVEIFDKKVDAAWKNFDPELAKLWRVDNSASNKLKFDLGNNNFSSILVSNSGRSGTNNRVHCSEYAKLCVKFPSKADEFITGTIPSVPPEGRIDIEGTAEGMAGNFYDMFWEAWNRGREPMQLEFKAHFYNWQWDEDEINKITVYIPTAEMEQGSKFSEYQKAHNLTDQEITYYYEKWLSLKKDWEMLHQEYPTTCVSGNSKIGTDNGYVLMKDLLPDGKKIIAKYDKGEKETFVLKTEMGYEIVCTKDHPILTQRGFVKLEDIEKGKDIVILRGSNFNNEIQNVCYKDFIADCSIKIDEDFALFLGLFMGDGSFAGKGGTISIACDNERNDVVKETERLMDKFFLGHHTRITGDKKGCSEVRISSLRFVEIFNQLGILRKNSSGAYKRKIKVPEFIKNSPKIIIKEFLRGLFEADGFADRNGNRVVFFSKYKDFIQDVQLLLLNFGITSRLRTAIKKAGNGNEYIGYDLSLRKEETSLFKSEIGFISNKKNGRLKLSNGTGLKNLSDRVVSIIDNGIEEVFDITTETHEFTANGIVVHNCEEAFVASGNTFFNKERITYLSTDTPKKIEVDKFSLPEKLLKYYIDGTLSIYEKPQELGSYVIGGDVAEGKGQDSSSCVCINNKTLKPAAEFDSNKIRPDEYAEFLNALGRYYNTAYLAVESNSGLWVLTELLETYQYPNLYWREAIDDVSHTVNKRLGYNTGTGSQGRKVMLDNLQVQVNLYEGIWTSKFLQECLVFVKDEMGRPAAMEGKHDDMVIAYGICHYVRDNAVSEKQAPQGEPKTSAERIMQRLEKLKGDTNEISQDFYI
jgi:intein/homing endonuclease